MDFTEDIDPQNEDQLRVKREVRRFITDPRHIDYECSEENKERLLDYLEAHDLPLTAASLHVAYEVLKEEGTLEVALPQEPVAAPEPTPAPVPTISVTPVAPARARTFAMFRNGQPISGDARKW